MQAVWLHFWQVSPNVSIEVSQEVIKILMIMGPKQNPSLRFTAGVAAKIYFLSPSFTT